MGHCIRIDYKFSHFLDLESSDCPNVEEIIGEIYFEDYDKDENESIKIGEIELHLYNYHFIDEGFRMFDAFDRSINTIKLGEAILDCESDEIRGDVVDLIGESFESSILVVHDFKIAPKYRGKGYGRGVLDSIETYFRGKVGYIALHSFPMQHDFSIKDEPVYKEYGLDSLDSDIDKSQLSLNLFYEDCGFVKVPCEFNDSSFFIKNIYPN